MFVIPTITDSGRRSLFVLNVASVSYKKSLTKRRPRLIWASLMKKNYLVEEVINKEGDDFEFISKSLVVTEITQLLSYMI